MSSNERELRLKATADAAQAKGEFKELTVDVAGVTAATEAQTAAAAGGATATAEQTAATQAFQRAMASATSSIMEFGPLADKSTKAATAAFNEASAATAKLEASIIAAKAAGAPVSPLAVETLAAYNAILAETAPLHTKAEKAVVGLTEKSGFFRAEALLAQPALGGFGRALAALAGTGDNAAASISKMLLPLAAVAGATVVVEKTLKELQARGVDVGDISGLLSKAMDALAVSMGGTSKASADVAKSFDATQKTFHDLEPAARDYASAQALITATGIDMTGALAAAIDKATSLGEVFKHGFQGGGPVDAAQKILRQFNVDLNEIRKTSPELAESFIRDFGALSAAAAKGSKDAIAALQGIMDAAHANAELSRDLIAQIKKDFGEEGPKAFGQFSAAAQALSSHLATLRAAGFSDAEAFAALKPEVTAVANGAVEFATLLPNLSERIRTAAKDALAMGAAFLGTTAIIAAHTKALDAEWKEIGNLDHAIEANSKNLEDRRRIITALLPSIDKMIADTDRHRDSEGKLDAAWEAARNTLEKYRNEIKSTAAETDKFQKIVDAQTKSLADLAHKHDDLTKAYEKQRAEVERTANSAIATEEKKQKAVSISISEEIAGLDRSVLGNREYGDQVAALQMKEVNARRKTETDISKITDDETIKLGELQGKYKSATDGILEQIGRYGSTLEEARKIRGEYDKAVGATSAALILEANKHGDAAAKTTLHWRALDAATASMLKLQTTGAPAVIGALDAVETKIISVNGHLGTLISNLKQIDVGAGATPGSEGGGAESGSGAPDYGLQLG